MLNHTAILLSNRIQSFFPLCNRFSNCVNHDLLSLVFDCLFEVLYICKRKSSAFVHHHHIMLQDIPNTAIYGELNDAHSSAAMKSGVFCRIETVASLLLGATEHCFA